MTTTRIQDYLGIGLLSARPTTLALNTAAQGLYYATDTHQEFVWNGIAADWEIAGGLLIDIGGTITPAATLFPGPNISFSGTTPDITISSSGTGGGSGSLVIENQGTSIGSAGTINAVSPVTAAISGGVATLTSSGGGSGPAGVAYRYFEFRFCNTWDTSYGAISLAEIDGYATVGGSTNIFANVNTAGVSNSWGSSDGAIATITSQPSSLALDGNLSTFWGTPGGNAYATIVIDLGSGNSSVLAQFGLTPRASPYYYQFPFQIDVYGSNNGSSWSHLGNFIGQNPPSQTAQLFTIPSSP